jgi:hypothetical protein
MTLIMGLKMMRARATMLHQLIMRRRVANLLEMDEPLQQKLKLS